MTNEPTAAATAADFIRTKDARLAAMFMAQPFNRVLIAQAFAKGLVNDTMQMGETIIALAELDLLERLDACEREAA
jgi:hypothetical protein